MTPTRLLALALAAALAACSGATDDPTTDAGPDDTADAGTTDAGTTPDAGTDPGARRAAVDAIIAAMCAREAACCGANETVAACTDRFSSTLEPLAANANITVDLAGAETCRTLIAGKACDYVSAHAGIVPVLKACAPFWTGTLANGVACGTGDFIASVWGDDECASGSCLDKKCAALAGVDGTCSGGGCQAGLECFLGKCRPQLASGADCEQEGLCVDGLECYSATEEAPHTCNAPKEIAAGAECAPGTHCALGNETCTCPVGSEGCLWGVCGDSSRCSKPD